MRGHASTSPCLPYLLEPYRYPSHPQPSARQPLTTIPRLSPSRPNHAIKHHKTLQSHPYFTHHLTPLQDTNTHLLSSHSHHRILIYHSVSFSFINTQTLPASRHSRVRSTLCPQMSNPAHPRPFVSAFHSLWSPLSHARDHPARCEKHIALWYTACFFAHHHPTPSTPH